MKAYIKHSTAISPQNSISESFPWKEIQVYTDKLSAIEPNYKEYFPPMKIRRMSRLVKMALCSAKICCDKSNVEIPDAIITATGWGCLEDTYKYLDEVTSEDAIVPSPATFIQSTHNTPGGQIALTLGCQNYNNVIVNGNTSFEYGLIDALMLINEGNKNILIGGFDEIATTDYNLKNEAGYWKEAGITSLNYINNNSEGTLPGEGASFMMLSSESDSWGSYVNQCRVFRCLPNYEVVQNEIQKLLHSSSLDIADIDIVLSGANGNNKIMPLYKDLNKHVFTRNTLINYKCLCGEYDTSSAFAVYLADNIIRSQELPAYLTTEKSDKNIKHILIYNYAGEDNHAITLISKSGL